MVLAVLALRDAGGAPYVERGGPLPIQKLEPRGDAVMRARYLLDLEQDLDGRPFARQEFVDGAGGTLAVGDRLDQVARSESPVAAGVDSRRRGGRGPSVYP